MVKKTFLRAAFPRKFEDELLMKQESAETIAAQALAWLAADQELLPVFMGASGASVDDLRARSAEPEFLGSVLDFILMDDTYVIGFADSIHAKYEVVMQARMALPGGGQVHWT